VLLAIVSFLLEKEHTPVFCIECCSSGRHQLVKNMEPVLHLVAVCKAKLSGTVKGIWQEEKRNELDFVGQINTGVVCVCV